MPIISLNKIAHPPKKITVLVLVAISVIILFSLLYLNIFAHPLPNAGACSDPSDSTPDNPCVNPNSQFTLCPGLVSQPACYIGSSPRPTLNWAFTPLPSPNPPSIQRSYWVQIDNNDEPTGNFLSPEVNRRRTSANNFYTVPLGRLQFNTTYYWKLATEDNHDTWSGWTCGDAFTTVNRCPPLQPTNLMATLINCSQIDLSWDNAANEDGYRIERKTGAGGIWAQIHDTGAPNITTYSDTDPALTGGNTYYYRVVAYNIGGDSPYSNEASLAMPLCIPTAFNLVVTGGDASTYCTLPPRHYFFWTYTDNSITGLIDGDRQIRYQLQVDDNSDFSSPEFDTTVNIGVYPCPNATCDNDNSNVIIVVCDPVLNMLDYNAAYYWQVKVWDDDGLDSGWVPYNDPADPDGDGDPQTFTTERHRYPAPDFIWSPQEPSANEAVLFTDQSACYEVIGCNNPIPCTGSWSWTFEDADPTTSIEQNPITVFSSDGVKQTTLEVIDSDGYGPCLVASSTDIGTALPGWKEILPW